MSEFRIDPDEEDMEEKAFADAKEQFVKMLMRDRRLRELKRAIRIGWDLTMGSMYKVRGFTEDKEEVLLDEEVADMYTEVFEKVRDLERLVGTKAAELSKKDDKEKDKEEEHGEE